MNDTGQKNDLLAKPISLLTGWGVPLVLLVALQFAGSAMPHWAFVASASAALAWMGAACLTNARRCGRRHCFYSGPVFLAAALVTPLVGAHLLPIGPERLDDVIGIALSLAALTFVSEKVWGKYVACDRAG